MRNTSDNLCKEYGLSILPSKYDYSKYAPNNLYKELMKDSIDYAIESAHGYDEFISILNDLNYTVTIRNNELSIKREPYKRNTRILKRFGNSYSLENIQKRILETIPQFNHLPEAYLTINPRLEYYYNCKNKLNKNKSNFSNLFSFYEKLFIVDMKNTSKSKITKYTPELIQAIKQMNEYSKQAIFLGTNNINTEEDLIRFKKEISSKTSPLKSKRENLWKKHKRAKTDEDKLNIENEIAKISKEIYPFIEDLKYCKQIQDRLQKYKEDEIKQQMIEENKEAEKGFSQKKNIKNKIR